MTVTTIVAVHPPAAVNVIVAGPGDTPPITPPLFTVATDVVLLVHVPLPAASVNVVVVPTHRPVLPVIGDIGFTVTTFVATQVPPVEYVIVVVPPLTPVT